jgi:hypothetical protein
MLMIHLKTRNFQNFRSFGPCTSTISIDQRNIMSVTWTLTSHPTFTENKQKNTKKTTKHPGALQRPWQLDISHHKSSL